MGQEDIRVNALEKLLLITCPRCQEQVKIPLPKSWAAVNYEVAEFVKEHETCES